MDIDVLQAAPALRLTVEEGRAAPLPPGHISACLLQEGAIEVHWYAPQGADPQEPHDRDELYVVVCGTAVFIRSQETTPFGDTPALPILGEDSVAVKVGDVLFVPAGTAHRFEATSPDFGTWSIFSGPEGGQL